MAHDSGIDPRYAAQFQRGFDPSVHTPSSPPTSEPERDSGPPRLPGGPLRSAERVAPPPRLDEVRSAPHLAAPADSAPHLAVPADIVLTGDDEPPARRIRWHTVLLAGGAAFMIGALALWWSNATDTASFSGGDPTDSMGAYLRQLRYSLAAPLFLAGALAVVGGVVAQAVRRMP